MIGTHTVIVVGAGPAGLSTAAELLARGVAVVVLERGSQVGASWAAQYRGLRFNTSRRRSALPGAPFPRQWGQFPTAEQYVTYLESYTARHRVVVETGVTVTGLHREAEGWGLDTSAGPRHARHVVLATGVFNQPRYPRWAKRADFTGRLLHSSDYREAAEFRGQSVLVAGTGSSGMEIAHQLARGGAGNVWLAVRTPPNIMFREIMGLPGDVFAPLFFRLPTTWADKLGSMMQRRLVGDLRPYGLSPSPDGQMTRLKRDGIGPAVVDREVIDAIRDGSIECVAAISALSGDEVVLADGRRLAADAVILATGYSTGLAPLVGELKVLDKHGIPVEGAGREALPGLRFIGFVFRPGLPGLVGFTARKVAEDIARQEAKRAAGPRAPAV